MHISSASASHYAHFQILSTCGESCIEGSRGTFLDWKCSPARWLNQDQLVSPISRTICYPRQCVILSTYDDLVLSVRCFLVSQEYPNGSIRPDREGHAGVILNVD